MNRQDDWIDYIVQKVHEHYNNRKVVLWGKYGISDSIKDKLKERYNIETSFYVDSDVSKIDNKQVFTKDCLYGKSKEFYVVIPLAFYQSLKDELIRGGIARI